MGLHASLIETCKMNNDVDPQAWLADVLDKIANRHPMSKIDELLPWAYINNGAKRQRPENIAYVIRAMIWIFVELANTFGVLDFTRPYGQR